MLETTADVISKKVLSAWLVSTSEGGASFSFLCRNSPDGRFQFVMLVSAGLPNLHPQGAPVRTRLRIGDSPVIEFIGTSTGRGISSAIQDASLEGRVLGEMRGSAEAGVEVDGHQALFELTGINQLIPPYIVGCFK